MRKIFLLASALTLCGCTVLPHDGPSAPMVKHAAARKAASFALVNLDYQTAEEIAAQPPAALKGLNGNSSVAPIDLIAAGDVLSVSVLEAGAAGLFARPSELATGNTPESFPRLVVDPRGMLSIPFAGDVPVAGHTPHEAANLIRRALHGRAIDPQVTVTVLESRANSVSVIGDVRNAGRFPLAPNSDHLLDAITAAGGATKQPGDIEVTVARGTRSASASLALVLRDAGQNIRLAPHDNIRLLYKPRKYSTFGALGHNSQTPIEDETLTLADAVSRAGGLEPNSADSEWVFVFRFERPAVAAALGLAQPPTAKGVPVVYRVNWRYPTGLFVANSFEIQPNDLIFVPRSRLTDIQQFFSIVNTVSQTSYNVRVTSALN